MKRSKSVFLNRKGLTLASVVTSLAIGGILILTAAAIVVQLIRIHNYSQFVNNVTDSFKMVEVPMNRLATCTANLKNLPVTITNGNGVPTAVPSLIDSDPLTGTVSVMFLPGNLELFLRQGSASLTPLAQVAPDRYLVRLDLIYQQRSPSSFGLTELTRSLVFEVLTNASNQIQECSSSPGALTYAGKTCAAGNFLAGFDSTGNLICSPAPVTPTPPAPCGGLPEGQVCYSATLRVSKACVAKTCVTWEGLTFPYECQVETSATYTCLNGTIVPGPGSGLQCRSSSYMFATTGDSNCPFAVQLN